MTSAVAESRSSSYGSSSTGFTDPKSINADGVREPFDAGAITCNVLTRYTINEEMIKKYKAEINHHEKVIGTYEMKINRHEENMDRYKAEIEEIDKTLEEKTSLGVTPASLLHDHRLQELVLGEANLRQHTSIVPTAERFVQSPRNVSAPQDVRSQCSETTVFFYSTGGYDEALRPLIEAALEPCAEKGYVDYETEWRVQMDLIGVNVVFKVAARQQGAAEAVHDALAGIRKDLEAKYTGGGSKEIRPC